LAVSDAVYYLFFRPLFLFILHFFQVSFMVVIYRNTVEAVSQFQVSAPILAEFVEVPLFGVHDLTRKAVERGAARRGYAVSPLARKNVEKGG
jgi:hypothetical protein